MRSVCVFCGSNAGADPAFLPAARALGGAIAASGRTLVYGGSNVGLMAALADGAIAAGGRTVGVIPAALAERGLAHPGLTDLRVVGTMHERKALMLDLADGFVALPGGIGTLDELFETLAWAQLGIHAKPCGLLEVRGFFDPLLRLLDHLVEQRFVRAEHRQLLLRDSDPARLLDAMASATAVDVPKWFDSPAGT